MIKEVKTAMNSALLLMNYIGVSPTRISLDSFYTHSLRIENYPPFAPKKAVISAISNSDRINLIKNDSLRSQLLEYIVKIEYGFRNHDFLTDHWKTIQSPFVVTNSNRLEMLRTMNEFNLPPSKFSTDITKLLSNPEFENITADVFWMLNYNKFALVEIQQYAEKLMNNIERNYNIVY